MLVTGQPTTPQDPTHAASHVVQAEGHYSLVKQFRKVSPIVHEIDSDAKSLMNKHPWPANMISKGDEPAQADEKARSASMTNSFWAGVPTLMRM
jgi:hypothetical protein